MKETAIIIPNYNGMQYLETCLSSLEKQTCREFTIYLVDNGSSEGAVDPAGSELRLQPGGK